MKITIKIETRLTENRSPGSNITTSESTAKKPKKVIRARQNVRRVVQFEDTEEDPTEDCNNDDDQYESMEGILQAQITTRHMSRMQQRKNADQQMDSEVQTNDSRGQNLRDIC